MNNIIAGFIFVFFVKLRNSIMRHSNCKKEASSLKTLTVFMMILGLAGCAAGRSSDCAYRNLVGKNIYDAELEAVREAGKDVRLLYPDSFLGFEKNPNRVNVIRDETDEIVAVNCG